MATYRITTFYSQSQYGWSETWWRDGGNIASLKTPLEEMLNTRAKLLTTKTTCQAVRISTVGETRVMRLLLAGDNYIDTSGTIITVPPEGSPAAGSFPSGSDQVRAAMQFILLVNGVGLSRRYLVGVPDEVSKTEPASLNIATPAPWWLSWAGYKNAICDGTWKVKAVSRTGISVDQPIRGWVQQAATPSLLGFIVAKTPGIPNVLGTPLAVRNVRMVANGIKSPNGPWDLALRVDGPAVDEITVYLRSSAGIDARSIDKPGIVRIASSTYFFPTNLVPVRMGTHKRGKIFGQLPGRQRKVKYAP